ncbi:aminoacylase-1-like [Zerene cesonia]|uniref:aminoacylase-1-like n=1 Tax=Zerene cesonia TaxID=33412 RepID=UPI0018E56802|nr:aminoacylase-1-like [Zerene cesonia]XP_038214772.1 aminoacylase-1-like [Zerene cesonia]XP_038214774.1 aminoacylase-1-like [Zerene cesonia]
MASKAKKMSVDYSSNPAVANFVEYLRIPSVQPNINYDDCVNFLQKQARSLDLEFNVYKVVPKKPIVVLTWVGQSPSLQSVLLNSHMDVVPVFEDSWTFPPFSGHIDKDGKIYGRGSQDMKCVGIQYIEAIRKLKKAGITLKRTLHLSFVPDEEIGGVDGMKKFVHTPEFKALNIAFALDEGMASPTEEFIIFYGERSIWQIHVHCTGQPGHGSLLFPNTAGEKLRYIINKFMTLRDEQKSILDNNPQLTIGDVTTINLTQVHGGVQSNVIPEKLTVVFDCRLAVTVDHEEFENKIKEWCKEAGEGVTYEFEQKNDKIECTKIDETNPFWVAFKSTADKLNLKLECRIFPGGTDSRYVREVGIPAIGFSPMNHTPVLLHDHDEYLSADIFLKGIDIYVKILTAVANA